MTERRRRLEAIHIRILAGDPTASTELFEAIHRPLWRVLIRALGDGGLSEEDAIDLATDSIVEYIGSPSKFQAQRASLFTYLAVIARGDALNRLRSIGTSKTHLRRLVELQDPDGNMQDEGSALARIDAQALLKKYGAEIVKNETDIAVLKLMLIGESDTDAFAAVLGVESLPPEQRKLAVKKYRDKIEKRLRRVGASL